MNVRFGEGVDYKKECICWENAGRVTRQRLLRQPGFVVFVIRRFLENKLRLPQYFLNDLQRIYKAVSESRLPSSAQSVHEVAARGVKNGGEGLTFACLTCLSEDLKTNWEDRNIGIQVT
jgi:hypothetical protein